MNLGARISRRDFIKTGIVILTGLGVTVMLKRFPLKKKMEGATFKKVLVIGIDGTDPNIMANLMGEGLLPNFSKLKDMGDFVPLETSLPPHSPVAWSCISTGVNPGKHNIFDFIRVDQKSYLPGLAIHKTVSGISGTKYVPVVKSEAFWRITSDNGVPTTIVRWPMTFPPDEVKGSMLSGLGAPDIRGFLGGYTFYTSGKVGGATDSKGRIVKVEHGKLINTSISGPRKREEGEITDIKVPMQIEVQGDAATLLVQGSRYPIKVGGWSGWIRIKFKAGLMNDAHGICRAHLAGSEPEFNMYVTAVQIDPVNPLYDISNPKKYSGQLADDIGLYHTLGMPEDTNALVEGRISDDVFLEQCAQIEAERDKMFWREFKNFKRSETGVLGFVYDTSDRIQHVFWDEKVLDKGGVTNPVIVNYLKNKDDFLGKVLGELDDGCALMIVSDHGFTSFERSVNINTWLVDNGFMTLTKKIGKGDDGALFKYVDWSKTKAYSVGFNSIFINLRGRERDGIVSDRESVVDEVIGRLNGLSDTKTGKKPITKMYKREDNYTGEYVKNAPDMIVGFERGYRMAWQNAVGGFSSEVISDNTKKWRGDHLVDPSHVPGVLFTNFEIADSSPNQLDVAPTVLSMLGAKVPEHMDGNMLI